MANASREHKVTMSVGGVEIGDWIEYEFGSSMVEPSNQWAMSRALTPKAVAACTLDSEVIIAIDGVVQMKGMIDEVEEDDRAGTMKVTGRDISGRLVQTSIPTIDGFDGLLLTDAVKKAASPWYSKVVLSDARNRSVRRGKGGKAPAQGEPAIFNVKGKLDEEHSGRLNPGEMCWAIMEQLASSVELLIWPSADGTEIIIGKPNYTQEVQFFFERANTQLGSSCINIRRKRSVRERYALIEVHGAGGGGDEDYGAVTVSKLGQATDGPELDGTGRDFKFPKRLVMANRAIQDSAEANRAAQREMNRRNFQRLQFVVEAPLHGQRYRCSEITLFAPNCLARLKSDQLGIDIVCIVYAVRFRGSRQGGESTELQLVPRGTVFVS